MFNVECNFVPSCSVYALQAIDRFGLIRGALLALRRIRKCNVRDQIATVEDPIPSRLCYEFHCKGH